LAKEEILIEWCDSREIRKTQARRQRSEIWRLCRWLVPLSLVLWGLLILLILRVAPWTADALSWWKLFLGGCAATVALPASVIVMASLLEAQRYYAVTDSGVKLGSRLYRWNRIAGYHIDDELSEDSARTLRLVLRNRSARCLRVPLEVSFENVVAIVSRRVPAVQWEDLVGDVMRGLMKPVPITIAMVWGVVLGSLVFTPSRADNFPWLLAITFFIGPGSIWILVHHWRRVRKNTGIVTMGLPLSGV
jgi:hypothetical protein